MHRSCSFADLLRRSRVSRYRYLYRNTLIHSQHITVNTHDKDHTERSSQSLVCGATGAGGARAARYWCRSPRSASSDYLVKRHLMGSPKINLVFKSGKSAAMDLSHRDPSDHHTVEELPKSNQVSTFTTRTPWALLPLQALCRELESLSIYRRLRGLCPPSACLSPRLSDRDTSDETPHRRATIIQYPSTYHQLLQRLPAPLCRRIPTFSFAWPWVISQHSVHDCLS